MATGKEYFKFHPLEQRGVKHFLSTEKCVYLYKSAASLPG